MDLTKVSKNTKFKDLPENIKNVIYHLIKVNTDLSAPPQLDISLYEKTKIKIDSFDTQYKVDLFEQCVTNCEYYKNKKKVDYQVNESLDIIDSRLDNFINANSSEFLYEMYDCILSLNGRFNKIKKDEN
ncbi:hypothetical protein TUBRATIS_24700 [Tubulinosema ratisbonensis]|uniref:Uncharacterized protein n=1 Tax=Tubulinosema ratisbonensis TaxID=291195 RepID=A0A437AJ17_9MICR|nr:hypothetical protein TUBRATIS_24700 [Tubulinosema ratisbonensis]